MKRLLIVLLTCAPALSCRRSDTQTAMIAIPGATLQMGCDPARDPSCSDEERPAHAVTIAPFKIDRTEVTQRGYSACVAASASAAPAMDFHPDQFPNSPVAHVTWAQADACCRLLGKRLPTEAEWELAARGTDGRIYPWGDQPPNCARALTHECGAAPAEVGTRPEGASPFGVLDMAGNVDEWVADRYSHYGSAGSGTERVARGGAWDAWHSRSTARNALQPDHHDALLGFRCASN